MEKDQDFTAAMGTLGAGLAHELKTPLSTIEINLQLLQEEWSNPVTEREVRASRRLQAMSRSMTKINEIIRSFVRFATDRPLKREAVELNHLVQELLDSELGDLLTDRRAVGRIDVTCDPAKELPPAKLDRVLIRQALFNLISNAIEAIPGPGRIRLRTWSDDRSVHVSVEDTGQGIAPENLDRIWNLYFTTKPSGIGMGLPIVKRLVEAHGGRVRVESRAGEGSTFTISLPREDA
jgi:signal transduction histidine kinase